MCCFSQPVEVVADTNIFARGVAGQQFLVYSMTYAASSELAMVLPLPVPPGSAEDAVRFINLEGYPEFFKEMASGFPPRFVSAWRSGGIKGLDAENAPLQVHDVGSFEASFVPRIEDFDRLDERFRVPHAVWDSLPAYHDFGFAVFKLKRSPRRPAGRIRKLLGRNGYEQRDVHPMAFEFPRRNPDQLYFPTLHVHDRKVHTRAEFDHLLYCQGGEEMGEYLAGWESSFGRASDFMDIDRCAGILDPDQPCRQLQLEGRLLNRDTLVGKGGQIPQPSGK